MRAKITLRIRRAHVRRTNSVITPPGACSSASTNQHASQPTNQLNVQPMCHRTSQLRNLPLVRLQIQVRAQPLHPAINQQTTPLGVQPSSDRLPRTRVNHLDRLISHTDRGERTSLRFRPRNLQRSQHSFRRTTQLSSQLIHQVWNQQMHQRTRTVNVLVVTRVTPNATNRTFANTRRISSVRALRGRTH